MTNIQKFAGCLNGKDQEIELFDGRIFLSFYNWKNANVIDAEVKGNKIYLRNPVTCEYDIKISLKEYINKVTIA